MAELDDPLHQKIMDLAAEGNRLADAGQYPEALDVFWSAWDLLPEPRTSWEAATWLLGSIGDVNFQQGNHEAARDNLSVAMTCPDAVGNPFLHLRLGQTQFELGNLDRAADELTRALVLGTEMIFEEEDPKYVAFVQSRLEQS